MDFHFEREAATGQPMPDGLRICEQRAFQTLAMLYARYNNKQISRDCAAEEKKKIALQLSKEYKEENFQDNLCYHHERQMRLSEIERSACRREPTPENTTKLLNVLDALCKNDPLRPVIRSVSDFRCPVCEFVFDKESAAREPNYCESCGARLGWGK